MNSQPGVSPGATDDDVGNIVKTFVLKNRMRIAIVTLVLLYCLIAVIVSCTAARYSEDLPSATDVKLVIVGFRHGHRNPAQFMKTDTSHPKWAWEGPSQLTNIGKRQAYSLGKFLRKRYNSLVSNEFYPSQVKAYSSSAERCQMTLQTVMSSFFEPRGRAVWHQGLLWQAIPYEINDPLLRMYSVKCPFYKEAYQGISDDSVQSAVDWLKRERNLTTYISTHSGLNSSLSDLADVADNVLSMKLQNADLPSWVTKPDLSGYPPLDMYSSIMQFAEAHQIMCADDPACSKIMAGLWLNQIVDVLQQKNQQKLVDRRVNFYAAHTETVLSLIRLVKAQDVKDTVTSAGFILEFTDTPSAAVRFLFHEPDAKKQDVRRAEVKTFAFCQGKEWCPLETFIENVHQAAFNDWQETCKLPKCPN